MLPILRTFWILTLVLLSSQLAGQSTSTKITKQFSDASLEAVLVWLKDNHGIQTAFDVVLAKKIVVTQNLKEVNPDQFFERILQNTPLTFKKIQANRYLIGPKDKLPGNSNSIWSGQVLDSQYGEPLAFASIVYGNNAEGTTTNENGRFNLQKVEGETELLVSYVGYKLQRIDLTARVNPIVIQLEPEIIEFDSITIVEELPALRNVPDQQGMKLDVSDLSALPQLGGGLDINRTIQLLPGVSAFDDLSAGIKVRGSSPDENMVFLDNLLLYNIDHFYGVFSTIDPEIVQEVNIYKNNFPIEYSGNTASVVEMKTMEDHPEQITGRLNINLLTLGGMVHLPLTKNMELLVSGRSTYQDVANSKIFDLLQSNSDRLNTAPEAGDLGLNRPDLLNIRPTFHFNDAYGKLNWRITPKDQLGLHFFNGFDQSEYAIEQTFQYNSRRRRVQNTETNVEQTDWRNSAIGLLYGRQWSKHLKTTLSLNQSYYQLDNEQVFSLEQDFNFQADRSRNFRTFQRNEVEGFRMDVKNTWKNFDFGQFIVGYTYQENKVNFELDNNNNQDIERIDIAQQHIVYGKQSLEFGDQLFAGLGLSSTHYSKTDELYFSPRLSLNYQINDHLSLKSSWAKYYQFLRQVYYEDPFGENQTFWLLSFENDLQRLQALDIPPINSAHLMVGGHLNLNDWVIDIELYQKRSQGVVEYAPRNPGFDLNQLEGILSNRMFTLFNGKGVTRGIDLLVQKRIKNYDGWLAYTLSKTTNQFDNVNDGLPYPSQDDRRHQLKFVNQYQIGNWTFSGNYIFASGRPYVDISRVLDNPIDRLSPNYDSNIVRLKDYHRVDIGVEWAFQIAGQKSTLGLSIVNLLNRQNVKHRQYAFTLASEQPQQRFETRSVIGTELQMLERIFNLSFGIEF